MSNAGRPAIQQNAILDQLRRQIVDGIISPGQRLRSHRELQREFGTTRVTVQRALDRLVEEGFVRAMPKIGRFVADRPPHLSRYAMVFSGRPDSDVPWNWSRFERAVVEASGIVAKQRGITIPFYFGVDGHPDSESYQSLMRDIEHQRLAGVIFTFAPHVLMQTPLMERSDPPRVNADPMQRPHSVTRVVDHRRFIYRSIDALLAQGRRRCAIITTPGMSYGFPDEFEEAAASYGITTYPFWTQAVEPHHTRWVRHAVDAILSTHAAEPPDSLLITDDHLVEPVAEALEEFGVRVPEQMRVIGHWNFPLKYRGRVPIDLLGFDARELVRSWVDAIDAQRRGEKVRFFATTPARFSWELPSENKQTYSGVATSVAMS